MQGEGCQGVRRLASPLQPEPYNQFHVKEALVGGKAGSIVEALLLESWQNQLFMLCLKMCSVYKT
eukprot:484197-Pelagomonas_calceolata.AAC.4